MPMPPKLAKPSAPRPYRPNSAASGLPPVAVVAFSSLLIARDAAYNLRDVLKTHSPLALLAVKHCERDLDVLERNVDEQTLEAIAGAEPKDARALLTAAKLISRVERIGDLILSVAHSLNALNPGLAESDAEDLTEMTQIIEETLATLHRGFMERDLECASGVLRADMRMDELRRSLFRRHLESDRDSDPGRTAKIILMAQALERAGDHVKNLAEELFFFTRGRSLRHVTTDQWRNGFQGERR